MLKHMRIVVERSDVEFLSFSSMQELYCGQASSARSRDGTKPLPWTIDKSRRTKSAACSMKFYDAICSQSIHQRALAPEKQHKHIQLDHAANHHVLNRFIRQPFAIR